MNVKSTFLYNSSDDIKCDAMAEGLLALSYWAVPESLPEDPEISGHFNAICKAIDGTTSQ